MCCAHNKMCFFSSDQKNSLLCARVYEHRVRCILVFARPSPLPLRWQWIIGLVTRAQARTSCVLLVVLITRTTAQHKTCKQHIVTTTTDRNGREAQLSRTICCCNSLLRFFWQSPVDDADGRFRNPWCMIKVCTYTYKCSTIYLKCSPCSWLRLVWTDREPYGGQSRKLGRALQAHINASQ